MFFFHFNNKNHVKETRKINIRKICIFNKEFFCVTWKNAKWITIFAVSACTYEEIDKCAICAENSLYTRLLAVCMPVSEHYCRFSINTEASQINRVFVLLRNKWHEKSLSNFVRFSDEFAMLFRYILNNPNGKIFSLQIKRNSHHIFRSFVSFDVAVALLWCCAAAIQYQLQSASWKAIQIFNLNIKSNPQQFL